MAPDRTPTFVARNTTTENTMTTTETIPTATATDTWADELAALKARHPHVREPILAALNILLAEPNITDDDAKARAAMRGVRITAASINGARNLLAKRESAAATEAPAPAAERPARPRRERAPEPAVDAEALIKQVVGKLQAQGNAEAERLREAMRKAMAVLASAIGEA